MVYCCFHLNLASLNPLSFVCYTHVSYILPELVWVEKTTILLSCLMHRDVQKSFELRVNILIHVCIKQINK
jgi:hypothetical protein